MRLRPPAALAALTAAAAAVRLATMDLQSYWFDEALTVKLLRLGLLDMLSELPTKELTPPFYYVVAWAWSEALGTGESGLRSLSVAAGAAAVPVAYASGRRLASGRVGLAVAALVAFNPLLIWYSQEARPYALFVLLGGLSFLAFLRALERPTDGRVAAWAAASALALLTHYFAVFLIVPEGLWLLARSRRPLAVVAAGAPVAAIGAALIPLARSQAETIATSYIDVLPLWRRIVWLGEDLATGMVTATTARLETVLALVATAIVVPALVRLARWAPEERRAALPAVAVAGGAVGLPVLLAVGGLDYFNTRNVIVAAVPLLLVPAIALGAARAGRPGLVGVGALCAIGVVATIHLARTESLQRDDWRGAAEALGPAREPRAVAAPFISGTVSLEVYLPSARDVTRQGARVRQLDMVALPREPSQGGFRERRDALPTPAAPAGFRLVGERREDTYAVFRYRARRPTRVEAESLRSELYPGAPGVLLQPSG